MATTTYTEGIGRRKTAQARVRIVPASQNSLLVNDMDAKEYFGVSQYADIALEPLSADDSIDSYTVTARVSGGGKRAQAEAIRHGLSRGLIEKNEALRSVLKAKGYLTRDPRVKERKKPGLKKARKASQWSKR